MWRARLAAGGRLVDASSSGHDGTLFLATSEPSIEGEGLDGDYLVLDSNGDEVTVDDMEFSGDFTVSFCFRAAADTPNGFRDVDGDGKVT